MKNLLNFLYSMTCSSVKSKWSTPYRVYGFGLISGFGRTNLANALSFTSNSNNVNIIMNQFFSFFRSYYVRIPV